MHRQVDKCALVRYQYRPTSTNTGGITCWVILQCHYLTLSLLLEYSLSIRRGRTPTPLVQRCTIFTIRPGDIILVYIRQISLDRHPGALCYLQLCLNCRSCLLWSPGSHGITRVASTGCAPAWIIALYPIPNASKKRFTNVVPIPRRGPALLWRSWAVLIPKPVVESDVP